MDIILQYLHAGGDLATVGVLYLLWRLDRRVLALETWLEMPRHLQVGRRR